MYGVPAVHSHTVKVEYTLICISMQSERRRRRPRWATNLFRDSRFIVSAPRSGARGSRPLRVVRDARSGVHQGAESFAGLEPRDLLRGNGHRGACFGVATQPWPARAHPKAPKPAQFDVVPRLEGVHDTLPKQMHHSFRLPLRQRQCCRHLLHEFGLGHARSSLLWPCAAPYLCHRVGGEGQERTSPLRGCQAYRYAARARLGQQVEHTAFEDTVAGRRVVISSDGGRLRLRETKRGPQTKKGRRRYTGAWREPKVLLVYVVDAEGKRDATFVPVMDATLKGPDAVFALLRTSLQRLAIPRRTGGFLLPMGHHGSGNGCPYWCKR